ncbi:hypothetical protein WICMUC_000284 [Wickerhamomyces mucosus]|uniref:C2H2-type domain-containing protein n=1 Tax=Wickerhamomyces mucosus TaxID=1378264 RepID=A0A9P8TJD8_9ASCO|nr:hypothetical protein WICMUC_000284 [Wickerhamomyces mucosus]
MSQSPKEDSQPILQELLFDIDELQHFLPKDYPHILPDGRIPLRYQVYQDKKVLRSVLNKPKKGVYMCNHCDLLFIEFTELLDHFDEFKIKRPHKCNHSDCVWKIVGFNRLRQLNRHKQSVHLQNQAFTCEICDKGFGRIDLFNRHLKNVHENQNSRYNKKLRKESMIDSNNMSNSNSKIINVEDDEEIFDTEEDENLTPIGSRNSPIAEIQRNTPQQEQEQEHKDEQGQQTSNTDTNDSNDSYKYSIEFLTK